MKSHFLSKLETIRVRKISGSLTALAELVCKDRTWEVLLQLCFLEELEL
ncbi:GSCOCG00005969001-RA-CDS [Cotesia congregata]|nr:GSCOCG00005969001-RA-CDS [Cotesia congregata]